MKRWFKSTFDTQHTSLTIPTVPCRIAVLIINCIDGDVNEHIFINYFMNFF